MATRTTTVADLVERNKSTPETVGPVPNFAAIHKAGRAGATKIFIGECILYLHCSPYFLIPSFFHITKVMGDMTNQIRKKWPVSTLAATRRDSLILEIMVCTPQPPFPAASLFLF